MIRFIIAGLASVIILATIPIYTIHAQFITTDWKHHNVGEVIELVNNHGTLHGLPLNNYGVLFSGLFPPESPNVHHAGIGPFFAALSPDQKDTMVTTTHIIELNGKDELAGYSRSRWDSVYVVQRGDTVDIGAPSNPYYENYVPKSEQDIVTRYNDYNKAALKAPSHTAMYIDVYQRSWSWSTGKLDQFVVFNLEIIPTRKTLHKFWAGIFFNPSVSKQNLSISNDDLLSYYPEQKLIIAEDEPGGQDGTIGTKFGLKVIPRKPNDYRPFQWTYL